MKLSHLIRQQEVRLFNFTILLLTPKRLFYGDADIAGTRPLSDATEESVFKEYTKEVKGYGSRGPQYDSNSYFMITRFGSLVRLLKFYFMTPKIN